MRNLKLALLAIGTVISLISFKDKAMETVVPEAKPPVAESYHSPQPALSSSTELYSPSPRRSGSQSQPTVLTASSSQADPSERNYFGGTPDTGTGNDTSSGLLTKSSEIVSAPPAPAANDPKVEPATTVVYGLAGTVVTDTGTNTTATQITTTGGSSSGSGNDDGGQVTPQQTQNNVFINGIMPNSGLPGTAVMIQGAGFDSNASNNVVKFGTVSSGSVTYISNNQLRAIIPQDLSAGFTDLSVSVNGAASKTLLFDVLKDASGNVFIDDTQSALPAAMNLADSSLVRLQDVDNDKDLDIFVVDTAIGSAYLLINDGNGVFVNETSSRLPAITTPSLISDGVFGDVNNDNYQDLVLSHSSGQSLSILINDGSGNFSDVTSVNMPALSGNASSVDLGDANGDGSPDLVIGYKDKKDVLLVNDASGIFSIDNDFNLPAIVDGSSDIRFCDVNNDGALDIITTNNEIIDTSSLRNRIYINDSQGKFTDSTEIILPEDNEYSEVLDSGDVNGDGRVDILVANHNQNALLINSGTGVFADETSSRLPTNSFASRDTKLGDFNGDGSLDIAMLGEERMSLLVNNGQGLFTEDSIRLPDYKSMPALVGGKNVQAADINGDGCLDIITGGVFLRILTNTASNKPPVLDNIGNKTVNVGTNLTFNVTASDPNGDDITISAENLPGNATFQSKVFNWTPTSSDLGQHSNIRFVAKESNTQDQLEDSKDITITVTGEGLPVIDHYVPEDLDLSLTLGEIVSFGVSAHDPNQAPITFKWYLNGEEIPAASGASSSIMFIVPKIGENAVEVRVANNLGETSLQWDISVGVAQNEPPVISSFSPNQAEITIDLNTGGGVSFGITATDTESDLLTYSWKFDGNALPDAGTTLSSAAYSAYLAVGSHTIEASVDDGHNTPVTHQWALHIIQGSTNTPPVISSFSPNQAEITIDLNTGGGVSFGITATDGQNDPLTYSWKFDGNALPGAGATLNSSAYSAYLTVGDHTIEASVSDGNNPAVTHQWALHITQGTDNTAPVAQNDSAVTNMNTLIDIDVLANDSDLDGNPISK
ncbi:MAG: FG-GAP-like repeat-containing protein, partial [Candidatus Omnitrophota bacterium]